MKIPADLRSSRPVIRTATMDNISIEAGSAFLEARLQIPPFAKGIIIFGQTTCLDHLSPETVQFAKLMEQWGLGVLLVELSKSDDQREEAGQSHSDIGLLAVRLIAAVHWLRRQPFLKDRHLGLLGCGSAGAAALVAGVRLGREIEAIVARDIQCDITYAFPSTLAPTLLVTTQSDVKSLHASREVLPRFDIGKAALIVMPGGNKEDEFVLTETIARRAARWFHSHWQLPIEPSRRPSAVRNLSMPRSGSPQSALIL